MASWQRPPDRLKVLPKKVRGVLPSQGDFRKIVDGVNQTLDAVIAPITEASTLVERGAIGFAGLSPNLISMSLRRRGLVLLEIR